MDQRYAARPQQGKVRVRNVREQKQQGKLVESQENQESQKSSEEAETATRRTQAAGYAQRNRNFPAHHILGRLPGPLVPLAREEQKTK